MKLGIGNISTTVVDSTEQERTWLRTFLTFGDSGSWFRSRRGGDGRLHLFNEFRSTFPTGCLDLVLKGLEQDGGKPDLVDQRSAPCAPDPNADLGWLRDYQKAAVDAVLARGRGILRCPTGSGKTEIAIGLVKSLPCRWLFLVHRTTLLSQTVERYKLRTGEEAGAIGDGEWREGARFTVGTFQTVHAALRSEDPATRKRALSLLSNTEGLIIDECHVLPAGSFWRLAQRTSRAYWRIGMSGTPLDRTDRRSVLAIASLGPIVYSIPAQVLVDAGVLAKPEIRIALVQHTTRAGSWPVAYNEAIVGGDVRNGMVVEAARRAAKPTLLFVSKIEHGRILSRLLDRAHINNEFVWGATGTESREASVRRLTRGDVDVVVCSVVFQEGLDVPSLRSVVVATGGKSIIATLQRIGRGMRTTSDKSTFEVWDFNDKGNKWLERHSRQRLRAYKREGYAVESVDLSTAQAPLPGLTAGA